MEEARNNGDKLKNAALEAQPSSVQGDNRDGVKIAQAGAIYMECRRNFVASIGGYMIDGCREFVKRPGGRQDDDKQSFLCATCGCHRSFHRKVLLPPHLLRDTRPCCIMNYLRSLPLRVMQPRPPTSWLMRPRSLPNYELIEGQGSSMSPNEAEEKSKSDSEEEVNKPLENNKEG
ncbi:hypothetical protein DITRI_Ditri08aG0160700 [Diplodiscus trichospermus]